MNYICACGNNISKYADAATKLYEALWAEQVKLMERKKTPFKDKYYKIYSHIPNYTTFSPEGCLIEYRNYGYKDYFLTLASGDETRPFVGADDGTVWHVEFISHDHVKIKDFYNRCLTWYPVASTNSSIDVRLLPCREENYPIDQTFFVGNDIRTAAGVLTNLYASRPLKLGYRYPDMFNQNGKLTVGSGGSKTPWGHYVNFQEVLSPGPQTNFPSYLQVPVLAVLR